MRVRQNTGAAGAGRRIGVPLLVTLALLAAVPPLATDLYLPAFPAMTDNLSTSSAAVQLSLTAFLIGAGVGQVIFGPVSDRTGRVPPLVAGLAVYVAASAGAALAPTAGVLIGARLIQGLSGAAGMVIGRAVISDLAEGAQAARAFSAMMLVSGVAPVVGPLAGSTLAGSVGWRGLLWIVAVLGAISLAAVVLVVRESHRAARRPAAAGHRDSMRALLSPAYAGSALAYGFGFATMMAYISASPFVYQELIGLSAVEYGIMFGLNALGLMAVSGLSARLAHRYQARSLAWAGLLINLGAVAVLCVLACLNIHSILLAAPLFLSVGSLGLVLGNTTAMALAAVPGARGASSAFLGLLQFGLAGVAAPLVGLGGKGTALPLAAVMLAASIAANLALAITRATRATPRVDVSAAPEADA